MANSFLGEAVLYACSCSPSWRQEVGSQKPWERRGREPGMGFLPTWGGLQVRADGALPTCRLCEHGHSSDMNVSHPTWCGVPAVVGSAVRLRTTAALSLYRR